MDFKETNEVCALLEGAAKAIAEARADGIVGLTDIFAFIPLISLGTDALKGADKVIDEFKGANGESLDAEITRLVKATVYFTQEVAELFKIFGKK